MRARASRVIVNMLVCVPQSNCIPIVSFHFWIALQWLPSAVG